MGNWQIYKHMVIPTKAAYEKITDADILEGREILSNSRALMLRYTTDFDCRNPTEWWYCLKLTLYSEWYKRINQIAA